jgi:hypothetical protein
MGAVSVCTAHATTSSTSRVARRPTYGTPRCHPLAPGPGRRSCGHLRTVQVSGKASRAKSSVLQRSSLSLVMATASTTSSHEMTRPMPSDLTKERRFTQHSVVSIVGSGTGAVRQHMSPRFQSPPVEPCMRFARTRLTDAVHRRHSVLPARPGRVWVQRWFPFWSGRSTRVGSASHRPRRTSRSCGNDGVAWRRGSPSASGHIS